MALPRLCHSRVSWQTLMAFWFMEKGIQFSVLTGWQLRNHMQAWGRPGAHRAALVSSWPFLFSLLKHHYYPKYAPEPPEFPSRQFWLPTFLPNGNVLPFSPRLSSTIRVWQETQICCLQLISVLAEFTNLKSNLSEGQTTIELQR